MSLVAVRSPAAFLAGPDPSRSPSVPVLAGDRTLAGIVAILVSTVCFPLSDLAAQSLMADLPPVEVAWLRYVVFFLASLPLLLRGRTALRTARPAQQVMRGLSVALGTVAALASFKHLPVADATAIGFVCPMFVTVLAATVLKEAVGPRRWLAGLVAFGGVAIVVQPGASAFQAAALLPVAGAMAGAVAVICTRLCRDDDPRTTVLITTAVGTLALTVLALPTAILPSPAQAGVLVVVGLCGAAGSVLQVIGYRLAPASLLAPFTSTQLLWATGLSVWLFGGVPHLPMLLGSAVIAGSAIYTGYRERARGTR